MIKFNMFYLNLSCKNSNLGVGSSYLKNITKPTYLNSFILISLVSIFLYLFILDWGLFFKNIKVNKINSIISIFLIVIIFVLWSFCKIYINIMNIIILILILTSLNFNKKAEGPYKFLIFNLAKEKTISKNFKSNLELFWKEFFNLERIEGYFNILYDIISFVTFFFILIILKMIFYFLFIILLKILNQSILNFMNNLLFISIFFILVIILSNTSLVFSNTKKEHSKYFVFYNKDIHELFNNKIIWNKKTILNILLVVLNLTFIGSGIFLIYRAIYFNHKSNKTLNKNSDNKKSNILPKIFK